MTIRRIESKQEWDQLVHRASPHSFLHTWNWGGFREACGEQVFRYGVFDQKMCLGIAQFLIVSARRGTYLLCPHGPIFFCDDTQNILSLLVERAREDAAFSRCIFLRFCPILIQSDENETLFANLGFRRAPTFVHPELTWLLDVSPKADALLSGMRKTTRHAIRRAEKEGVAIVSGAELSDVERFYAVYEETKDRQHFVPFSQEYVTREFEAFAPDNRVRFFFALHQEKVIATALIIFTDSSAFYHHGASSKSSSNIPASHLLLWHVIQEAKNRGCQWMNFYGIAPEGQPNHPWAGLSLFKKGFGGFAEQYVPTQDYVLHPFYWITYSIEKARRWKRRV